MKYFYRYQVSLKPKLLSALLYFAPAYAMESSKEATNLFPSSSSIDSQTSFGDENYSFGSEYSLDSTDYCTWDDGAYISDKASLVSDDKDSFSTDDQDYWALNFFSQETSSRTSSGASDSSEQDGPLIEQRSGLWRLCNRPFDFLLFSKSLLRIPQFNITKEEEFRLFQGNNDLLNYTFYLLLNNSTEECLPAYYKCPAFLGNPKGAKEATQVHPIYSNYNSLRSNYCRLSLVSWQMHKAMRVYAIESVLYGFLKCSINDKQRKALMADPLSKGSSCYESFTKHLFEQMRILPLKVKSYSTFKLLPLYISLVNTRDVNQSTLTKGGVSERFPREIVFEELSVKEAVDRLYEVLYDISKEKTMLFSLGAVNYSHYLSSTTEATQTKFVNVAKTCCFDLKKEYYSPTFIKLIHQCQKRLEEKSCGSKLELENSILNEDILFLLNTLYEISFSFVEDKFPFLVEAVGRNFSNLISTHSGEALEIPHIEILNKCQKYPILRSALLFFLISHYQFTAKSRNNFLKTYVFCPERLLYFADFFKTYLGCVEVDDRIDIIASVLIPLEILSGNKKIKLELIGYILEKQVKDRSFLKSPETADNILLEAFKEYQMALLQYIPKDWLPSESKRQELIGALQKIKKDDLAIEDLEIIKRWIDTFSKK